MNLPPRRSPLPLRPVPSLSLVPPPVAAADEMVSGGAAVAARPFPLCAGIALRVPVVQANLGPCDTIRLAAEVSRAGGLGTFTVKSVEVDAVRRAARALRQRSAARPVLVALNQPYEQDEVLDTCMWYGLRYFQVFWWNGPRLARRIHARSDARVFWQVSSVRQAEEAVVCGADVLILQGTEAGGQVRGSEPLFDLVAATRRALGDNVSLVAGGGLADRADVRRVLEAGARAALFGTRFLLSHEARAGARWKARLLRARGGDLLLDTSIVDSQQWPCAPRRRLDVPGVRETSELYAGLGVDKMQQVLSARAIVRRLSLT